MTIHTNEFEVFLHCIGDKLLFQTSKGNTIEINNLNISIIINNDGIVNKMQLTCQSFYNRINISKSQRDNIPWSCFILLWSHICVSSHTSWQKSLVPCNDGECWQYQTWLIQYKHHKLSREKGAIWDLFHQQSANEASQSRVERVRNKTQHLRLLSGYWLLWMIRRWCLSYLPATITMLLNVLEQNNRDKFLQIKSGYLLQCKHKSHSKNKTAHD